MLSIIIKKNIVFLAYNFVMFLCIVCTKLGQIVFMREYIRLTFDCITESMMTTAQDIVVDATQ